MPGVTRIDLLRPGFQSPVAAVGYPDFAAYAKACGGDAYCVETLEAFERAFAAALASGRPTVIDAKITRWALPHYSSSPRGVIPAIWERWKSVSAVADNFPLSPHDG